MACFIFKQLNLEKKQERKQEIGWFTVFPDAINIPFICGDCRKIIKWGTVSLSGCSLPVSRGLQLGLQPLGPLRLVPQWLEELADGHLLAVDPRCRHAQVKTFAALRTAHIANAVHTSVLGGIISVRSQSGIYTNVLFHQHHVTKPSSHCGFKCRLKVLDAALPWWIEEDSECTIH